MAPFSSGGYWLRVLTSARAAGIILLAFWLFMVASLLDKSATADELGDIMSGYTYWRFNDYRMNPEHGNLPMRLMAFPLLGRDYQPPSTTDDFWIKSNPGDLSYSWFYKMKNDATGMLLRSRAISSLLAVALGAFVWRWARQLFGPVGGMVSLLLYVFNPTILANGGLATTDLAASLFFLVATGSLWAVLHRLSVRRVLLSALAVAGLFLSKLSAVLIVPIALALVVARLISSRPLPVALGGGWELKRRSQQTIAFAAVAATHVLIVVTLVWGFYGFRYAMFAHATTGNDRPTRSWESLLGQPSPFDLLGKLNLKAEQTGKIKGIFESRQIEPRKVVDGYAYMELFQAIRQTVLTYQQAQAFDTMVSAPPTALGARIIDFIRRRKLLPEAYLYGYANVWTLSQARPSFLNGRFGIYGWKWFFPYTFLVKTPLPVFLVMGLAVAAAAAGWRSSRAPWRQRIRVFYETLPCWALLAFYWAILILSHSDIGHRYIMPVYAPLFVLCGASAYWLGGWRKPDAESNTAVAPRHAGRWAGLALGAGLLALAAEMLCRYPNYLAYFNGIVSPPTAYRHLVDSSLDWGQDLPGLKRYIGAQRLSGPVYLSYFGEGSPGYYKIPATYIRSYPGEDVTEPLLIFTLPAAEVDARLVDRLGKQGDYEVLRGAEKDGKVVFLLLKRPAMLRLAGGTYFISATMLQPVTSDIFGDWNWSYEASYQRYYRLVKPLLGDDEKLRMAALQGRPLRQWQEILNSFDAARFARLTAYLRRREPDDNVNFSILVYKLTDADIARALDGPPSDVGLDGPALSND